MSNFRLPFCSATRRKLSYISGAILLLAGCSPTDTPSTTQNHDTCHIVGLTTMSHTWNNTDHLLIRADLATHCSQTKHFTLYGAHITLTHHNACSIHADVPCAEWNGCKALLTASAPLSLTQENSDLLIQTPGRLIASAKKFIIIGPLSHTIRY